VRRNLVHDDVPCGVELVEDPHHQLALIEALRPEEIPSRESELLADARRWMPRLPFPHLDVLVMDEMGKNISGAGPDGRHYPCLSQGRGNLL
jgi:hypothetical protein